MRVWNVFFGSVLIIIIVTMMAPAVFGLQSFTQWGGMYVDGWCTAYVQYDDGESAFLRCPQKRVAWFAPMHSRATCAAWAQSLCGTRNASGKIVRLAAPYYRGGYFLDDNNMCDLPFLNPPWFSQ